MSSFIQLLRCRILFASFPLLLLATNGNSQADYHAEITRYATELYKSLDDVQQRSARLQFEDTSRLQWNNLPVGMWPRKGTGIGDMNVAQRQLLHRILSASLSSQGYLKATAIMHLDNLINQVYDSIYYREEMDEETYKFIQSLNWSHKNYYFAFFGKPSDATWGYKLEGHHLSINFTFAGDSISVTPFFIGSDPAEYPISEYAGWRVLGQEEDLGIKLINLLSKDQQGKATMSKEVPADIITSAQSGRRLVDDWGLLAKEMTTKQKAVLHYIVREFVFNMEYDKAMVEYQKIIAAGLDKIYFGWIGSYDEKLPHYYVINGPTFLIEFDNNGGPRQGANHIHAIWREKGNEYGEDVLKKHYQKEPHH